jgi:hypothetical protein
MHPSLSTCLVGFAAAWLGACAASTGSVAGPSTPAQRDTVESVRDACDSTKAQWAIGEQATDALLDRARQAAGARSARFLRPGQSITLEYLDSRLNLELDGKDVVRTVRCG